MRKHLLDACRAPAASGVEPFQYESPADRGLLNKKSVDIELVKTEELRLERLKHMYECGGYFQNLWNQKLGKPPTPDLISMMMHSDAMAEMDQMEIGRASCRERV